MSEHPVQPLEWVGNVIRFKPNKIVQYLLDNGGIDLNQIALQGFSDEDQEHFAQLIGYSFSGWGGLSYVTDETWEKAAVMNDELIAEGNTE
jgi:hypothetical protein